MPEITEQELEYLTMQMEKVKIYEKEVSSLRQEKDVFKMEFPDKFNGNDRTRLRPFLTKFRTIFSVQSHSYDSDERFRLV